MSLFQAFVFLNMIESVILSCIVRSQILNVNSKWRKFINTCKTWLVIKFNYSQCQWWYAYDECENLILVFGGVRNSLSSVFNVCMCVPLFVHSSYSILAMTLSFWFSVWCPSVFFFDPSVKLYLKMKINRCGITKNKF